MSDRTTAVIYGLGCICSAGCFQREETPLFPPLGARVIDFGVGTLYGCALAANGGVGCWRGATPKADATLARAALGGRALRFAVLANGGCALIDSGEIQCWDDVPHAVPRIGTSQLIDRGGRVARDIGASAYSFCIAWQDGDVSCWGHNVVRGAVR